MKTALWSTALLLPLALGLGGCMIEHGGPLEHESKSIDLDKSEMVRVDLKMGAGEMQIDGGSQKLMDADFDYNIPSWKPVVHYEASGFRGQLRIEQPGGAHGGSHSTYKWKVRLNNTVPLDVTTELGAGEAQMTLGSLNLRSLDVSMGVGEARVDLKGKPTHDYSVKISGGVGHATVYLPNDVSIIATAHGGIGDINIRGLEKRGSSWINAAHENGPVTIHLDVNGGIGQIEIIAE